MKLSISKKFAKRSIKCLALFAPLAYLFGSLFFGLNGAHSGGFYADNTYYVDRHISVVQQSVLSFEEPNYKEQDSSVLLLGNLGTTDAGDYYVFKADVTYESVINPSSLRVRFPIIGQYVTATDDYFSLVSFGVADLAAPYAYRLQFVGFPSEGASFTYYIRNAQAINLSKTLSFLNNYQDMKVYYETYLSGHIFDTGVTDFLVREETSGSFYEYLQSSFMASDNFLRQWGENAISENPLGFAPFGSFLKFIDENMLHLSDSQIGLMGYGYIYYCLHILIAFLAFDCVAFIPQLIMKVIHQFNKGVDTDD